MFMRRVKGCRARYPTDDAEGEQEESRGPNTGDCDRGFVILTMGNDLVMRSMVPLLLESLQRIAHVGPDGARDDLTRHTTVVGVTRHADEKCEDLRRSYSHSCTGDGSSGLYDGDNVYPSHKALAYGMVKLRYLVNALTTNLDILYVDADVVFLRDPIPLLLAAAEQADADVVAATAAAPCGSAAAQPWDPAALGGGGDGSSSSSSSSDEDGEEGGGDERHRRRRALASDVEEEAADEDGGSGKEPRVDAGEGVRYATGLVLYRSTPAALRCAYSLLLDMAHLASRGHSVGRGSSSDSSSSGSSSSSSSDEEEPVVWEQERFAAFMPTCMAALGRGLAALPPQSVLTTCGADAPPVEELAGKGSGGGVVAVHVSSAPPGGAGQGGAVEASLAARVAVMKKVLGIQGDEEDAEHE